MGGKVQRYRYIGSQGPSCVEVGMLNSYLHNTRNRPMTNKHSISPLRQRMIDDMTLRKLGPNVQIATKILREVKGPLEYLALQPPA